MGLYTTGPGATVRLTVRLSLTWGLDGGAAARGKQPETPPAVALGALQRCGAGSAATSGRLPRPALARAPHGRHCPSYPSTSGDDPLSARPQHGRELAGCRRRHRWGWSAASGPRECRGASCTPKAVSPTQTARLPAQTARLTARLSLTWGLARPAVATSRPGERGPCHPNRPRGTAEPRGGEAAELGTRLAA